MIPWKLDLELTFQEQFNIKIFEETLKDCAEWADDLYFKSWVEMDLDVQTAAGVTVIVSNRIAKSVAIPSHKVPGQAWKP